MEGSFPNFGLIYDIYDYIIKGPAQPCTWVLFAAVIWRWPLILTLPTLPSSKPTSSIFFLSKKLKTPLSLSLSLSLLCSSWSSSSTHQVILQLAELNSSMEPPSLLFLLFLLLGFSFSAHFTCQAQLLPEDEGTPLWHSLLLSISGKPKLGFLYNLLCDFFF